MPIPADPTLYERIKSEVYKEIPKHSLFRSAHLVRRYKDAGGTYIGKENKSGLDNWFKSKWISINDLYHLNKIVPCGSSDTEKKYNEYPLCRPLEIAKRLTKSQMKQLIDAKNQSKEIPIRTEAILKTTKYNVSNKYT